jgi:hypothetical protein
MVAMALIKSLSNASLSLVDNFVVLVRLRRSFDPISSATCEPLTGCYRFDMKGQNATSLDDSKVTRLKELISNLIP